MARRSPSPRPMKSRKNGLKHEKRIKKNTEVINKITKQVK